MPKKDDFTYGNPDRDDAEVQDYVTETEADRQERAAETQQVFDNAEHFSSLSDEEKNAQIDWEREQSEKEKKK